MSAGAVSQVVVPPDPATSGTTLTVTKDEGAKFLSDIESLPFVALVFPVQQSPVYGQNAERVDVLDVQGDVLTIDRSDTPISITRGLQIAVLSVMPDYDYGSTVTLSTEAEGTQWRLSTRDPSGRVASYDGLLAPSQALALNRSGIWHYRWEANGDPQPEQRFFARYSAVL